MNKLSLSIMTIKLSSILLIAQTHSVFADYKSISALSINNDYINNAEMNSVIEVVKSSLGTEYQNENYDPISNAVDLNNSTDEALVDYNCVEIDVLGDTKYQCIYAYANVTHDRNVFGKVLNAMDLNYISRTEVVLQDTKLPKSFQSSVVSEPVPFAVYGAGQIVTSAGKSLFNFTKKISDPTEELYADNYFKNVDLSVYPIYGCGEVGKEIHFVDRNGNTIARYNPNLPDGYDIDNPEYGFAITGKYNSNYSNDPNVFDGRTQIYINKTTNSALKDYGKLAYNDPFWFEHVCYPWGQSSFSK